MHFWPWFRPEPGDRCRGVHRAQSEPGGQFPWCSWRAAGTRWPVPLVLMARTTTTSAKCSLRPVASCCCAPGSGCDLGDGAQGAGSCCASDAGADALDVASLLDRPVERLSQQQV